MILVKQGELAQLGGQHHQGGKVTLYLVTHHNNFITFPSCLYNKELQLPKQHYFIIVLLESDVFCLQISHDNMIDVHVLIYIFLQKT